MELNMELKLDKSLPTKMRISYLFEVSIFAIFTSSVKQDSKENWSINSYIIYNSTYNGNC